MSYIVRIETKDNEVEKEIPNVFGVAHFISDEFLKLDESLQLSILTKMKFTESEIKNKLKSSLVKEFIVNREREFLNSSIDYFEGFAVMIFKVSDDGEISMI